LLILSKAMPSKRIIFVANAAGLLYYLLHEGLLQRCSWKWALERDMGINRAITKALPNYLAMLPFFQRFTPV